MFWKKLVILCNQNGTTPTTIVKELGISTGSVTGWKNGAIPRDTTLKLISDYFGVDPSYFFEEEEKIESFPSKLALSDQATELLNIFEQLSVVNKAKLLVYAEELKNT